MMAERTNRFELSVTEVTLPPCNIEKWCREEGYGKGRRKSQESRQKEEKRGFVGWLDATRCCVSSPPPKNDNSWLFVISFGQRS
jgi:hypothetical protein